MAKLTPDQLEIRELRKLLKETLRVVDRLEMEVERLKEELGGDWERRMMEGF